MQLTYVIAIPALVALYSGSVHRVRNEYECAGELSRLTIGGVWILYLAHLVLSIVAAVNPEWSFPLNPLFSLIIGLLFMLTGVVIAGAGIMDLGSFDRMSGADTSKRVTTGIYRWSRNPQNLGWLLFLLGLAVFSRSVLTLLLAMLFWAGFRWYLPTEEDLLEQVYGERYRRYRDQTRRYLGPPQKSKSSDRT